MSGTENLCLPVSWISEIQTSFGTNNCHWTIETLNHFVINFIRLSLSLSSASLHIIFCSQSLGAALLAVAIWIRGDGGLWEFVQALDIRYYYSACYVIMACGLLLLVFGFVGCLGAATESPCMLIMVTVEVSFAAKDTFITNHVSYSYSSFLSTHNLILVIINNMSHTSLVCFSLFCYTFTNYGSFSTAS